MRQYLVEDWMAAVVTCFIIIRAIHTLQVQWSLSVIGSLAKTSAEAKLIITK